jgi:hypothetical protein
MGKGSAWTKFATNVYRREKAKNADFKFKDALKMAAKEYKGGSGPKSEGQAGGMGEAGPKSEGQSGGMGAGKDLQKGGKRRGSYKKRSHKRKSHKRKSHGRRSRRYNKK